MSSSGSINLADLSDEFILDNPFTVTGVISGSCEGQTFSCSLNGIDAQNEAAFLDNCSF